MNRTIEQSYCCLAVNADSASSRLLSYTITLSLDIFSSFPPVDSYQASGGVATNVKPAILMCRTVCAHGKTEGGSHMVIFQISKQNTGSLVPFVCHIVFKITSLTGFVFVKIFIERYICTILTGDYIFKNCDTYVYSL